MNNLFYIQSVKNKLKEILGYKFFKSIDGHFLYKNEGFNVLSISETVLINGINEIFKKKIYEFRSSKESPLIIDGGANIGLGVIYWKSIFPKARIIAFEPSKEIFPILEENVKVNKLKDVILYNKALSKEEGLVSFTTNKKNTLSGSLRLEKKLGNTYQVETVKLSDYLDEKIDLLKLDIEGAEKYVMPEIAHKLNNIENFFLEYHSFSSENQYLSNILNLFEENNFRYYIESEVKRHAPFDFDRSSLQQDLQLNIWAKKIS